MHWHIDTDLVSLVTACFLLIYYYRAGQHNEAGAKSKGFLACLWVAVTVTAVDIVASIAMEATVSRLFYHIMMTLYFALIEQAILAWFYYTLAILFQNQKKQGRGIAYAAIAPYALYIGAVVSNPWTGLFYVLGENNAYQRGPLFFMAIALFAAYTLAIFALTLIRRNHIPQGYSAHVLIMMPVLLAISIAVQLLNPGWLTIMPGYVLCMLISFLFLQTKKSHEQQALVQTLSKAASTDKLTGIFNRAGAEAQVQLMYLGNINSPCMTSIVDIDNLKLVNDSMGHPEGDRAIQAVAEVLRQHFRSSDIVARFGGDEFMVFMIGDLNESQEHRTLRALVRELGEIRVGENDDYSIHCSIGAACGVVGSISFEALCKQADTALYHVKRSGKNNYAMYRSEMVEKPVKGEESSLVS